MKIINYLLLSAVLLSGACATIKGKSKMVTIKGKISVEQPICNGPTPEKGEPIVIANTEYYMKLAETNDPSVIATKVFKTDENGNFTIKLEPGTYAVLYPDKLMTYAEFRLKYGATSTYMKNKDERCFEKWYASPDFLLKANSDTTVNFLVKSRCYTKTNPCWQYTGPK